MNTCLILFNVYGCNLNILWFTLRKWDTPNFYNGQFWSPSTEFLAETLVIACDRFNSAHKQQRCFQTGVETNSSLQFPEYCEIGVTVYIDSKGT